MIYPDLKFVDSAFNGVNHRNKVIEVSKIKTLLPQNREDCYITYFRFPKEYKEHCQKTGSVGGYRGKCYSDFFFMDIDNQDLSEAHRQAKNILLYIEDELELSLNSVEIYFSGAKGFHVAIPSAYFGFEPSEKLPEIHRAIAKELFNSFNIDFAIYDINRLFRLPNTKHSKTGLYKVILDPIMVLHQGLEQIQDYAKSTYQIQRNEWPSRNEFLNNLVKRFSTNGRYKDLDKKIAGKITPLIELINSEIDEGSRNESCFSFALELRKKGLRKNEVRGLTQIWNSRNLNPPLDDGEVDRTIESAFRFQTKNTAEKLSKIKTIKDLEYDYRSWLKILKEKGLSFHSFIPTLAKQINPISFGNIIGIAAATGVGKTAFFQTIIYHWRVPALAVNLETSSALLFERYMQMSNKTDSHHIKQIYNSGESLPTDKLSHIITLDDTNVNIDEIVEYWELAQEKIGGEIPIIGIDHKGLLKAKGGTIYERATYTSDQLIELAKRTNTVVIALTQVPREVGGDGDRPLPPNIGKDSGAFENACSLLFGLYRPNRMKKELDKETGKFTGDNTIVIQILKQRAGVEGIKDEVSYNGETQRIYEEIKEQQPIPAGDPGDETVPF